MLQGYRCLAHIIEFLNVKVLKIWIENMTQNFESNNIFHSLMNIGTILLFKLFTYQE